MSNRFEFQGKNKRSSYFEGWYVKCSDDENDFSMALIPGVAHFETQESSVQYNIYYKGKSYSGKITFSREDFDIVEDPYTVLMPSFVFSENGIKGSLRDGDDLFLIDISFGEFLPIETSLYAPTIMGPCEYFKMPCSHDVVSMKHSVKGKVIINGEKIILEQAQGYIEKDRGSTFPNKYLWTQANQFEEDSRASFFLAIGEIEVGYISVMGTIAIFHDGDTEHRFSTYLGTRVDVYVNEKLNYYKVTLSNRHKKLTVKVNRQNETVMIAPMNESMDYPIKETVKGTVTLLFKEKNQPEKRLTSFYGGAELVNWS